MPNTISHIRTYHNLHKLARFINFHSHPHGSFYNAIEGIITYPDTDIETEVTSVASMLRRNHYLLPYDKTTDPETFLRDVAQAVQSDMLVFIICNTDTIHPVIYDQLMNFRQRNQFNVAATEAVDIHPNAKVFMVFSTLHEHTVSTAYELTDHVLDLTRKEQ
jgi:hypothetical protein